MKKIKDLKAPLVSIDIEGNVKINGKEINFDPATALLILLSTKNSYGHADEFANNLLKLTCYKEK